MRRLAFSFSFFSMLAVPALFPTPTVEAAQPIRTANSRLTQLDPAPTPTPLPPAPMPAGPGVGAGSGTGPIPSGQPPSPSTGTVGPAVSPAVPAAPVPPPEPGGATYSQPWGTMKDRTPPPKQYLGDPDGTGSYHSPTNAPTPSGQPLPPLEIHGPTGRTDRFGVAPPPGTLGQTYYRRTRMIDEKKHPRVGVVEVHLSENYDVSALGLKSKWTGKLWELESDPLLPGIPHVYEVKAEWGPEGSRRKEVRTIRMVMGRVVDLEF